jgi:hypothetical protein
MPIFFMRKPFLLRERAAANRGNRRLCQAALLAATVATTVIRTMSRSRSPEAERFPAISVRQPAADQIVRGTKRRDVRSRPSRFRGWILIHASQTLRRGDLAMGSPDPERGKLLGIARLEDCVKEGDGWSYVWAKPHRFRVAVPCRGHYSIPFYVPASLVRGTPAARRTPGRLKG